MDQNSDHKIYIESLNICFHEQGSDDNRYSENSQWPSLLQVSEFQLNEQNPSYSVFLTHIKTFETICMSYGIISLYEPTHIQEYWLKHLH